MRNPSRWWGQCWGRCGLAAVAILAVAALTLGPWSPGLTVGGERAVAVPPPTLDNPKASGPTQTAVLAAGCFWGVQGVYQHVHGVQQVLSGYAGGGKETADYETVSRGDTGHAESVEIRFDPQQVSYGELLQIYFSVVHDPTQLNRQGPDVGSQYRSNVFFVDEAQKRIAQAYIAQLARAKVFPAEIVTRVDPLRGFYPAEAYHQDFMLRNPDYPYIVVHDLPKLEHFKAMFPARYNERPVTALRSK
jgi:peptide-methionine (S)-S-oxide reductase